MQTLPPKTNTPPLICIMGPTASGKTALAVKLVQSLPVEIISVDSAMVYRGMDIGTAKPDAATMAVAPHRLIDIRDPAESYSAAEFRRDALQAIAEIRSRGRVPLLTGGTMLYFRALQRGLSDMPGADPKLRAELDAERLKLGNQRLHARLEAIDPVSAKRIHPNDPQRVQRALEVYLLSGQTMTDLRARDNRDSGQPSSDRWLKLALMPDDRVALHHRIEHRFHAMLEQGLIAEVEKLRQHPGVDSGSPAARTVGYRQVWQYLSGLTDHARMVEGGIAATRQYAKRQLTWLRSETDTVHFASEQSGLYKSVVSALCRLEFFADQHATM